MADLSPSKIWMEYKSYWWSLICFMAPALTLFPNHDILHPFHRKLPPLLKINQNILTLLVSIPFYMGGFDLRSLKIEQGIEVLGIIISTYKSTLPTSNLF